ncbi:MAG TPA: hypothetical protein ENJ95_01185 [Bacteroidetes bacterium]|nr:hypothetical protein [Bacteroidota bacterium]
MDQNNKFQKAARRRRQLALWATVLLHLAVIAAISNRSDLKKIIPDFVKELFEPNKALPRA